MVGTAVSVAGGAAYRPQRAPRSLMRTHRPGYCASNRAAQPCIVKRRPYGRGGSGMHPRQAPLVGAARNVSATRAACRSETDYCMSRAKSACFLRMSRRPVRLPVVPHFHAPCRAACTMHVAISTAQAVQQASGSKTLPIAASATRCLRMTLPHSFDYLQRPQVPLLSPMAPYQSPIGRPAFRRMPCYLIAYVNIHLWRTLPQKVACGHQRPCCFSSSLIVPHQARVVLVSAHCPLSFPVLRPPVA